MLSYILKRIVMMIPTIVVMSIVSFTIIQLPPGDWLTTYVANLEAEGGVVDQSTIEMLRARYGLGQPLYVQYLKWAGGILRGDFGQSFQWKAPVADLIWGRLQLTVIVTLASLLFTWLIAFPVGIYSAVKQYSIGDYIASILGYLGLSTPNFLLALSLMVGYFLLFRQSVGGLFSEQYIDAPWSWARVVDLLKHIWIPMVVLGTSSAAGLIRIMRANLLDELNKAYVETARAKGLSERRLVLRYPVRVALNPFVSTVGWVLPQLVSGSTITAVVLNLPMVGPLMLGALLSQDMFLAGSFLLLLSMLTVIGTLVSDILLAWLDPRIRLQ